MPKKSKVCAFTPADANNLPYAEKMLNSLRKFHSKKELPCDIVGPERLDIIQDPHKFYRMTPMVAKDLLKEYDAVLKLDADQIITGDLSHIWKGNYDIACVNNSNPRELKALKVAVWDIHPLAYLNCGFVVMKSQKFVDHWWRLCKSPHFESYQYREQDLLNIMCFYGDYKVKLLDMSKKWHGLIVKGYEPWVYLEDGKLWIDKNEEWPKDEKKQVVCYHIAGGQGKTFNPRIKFKSEVVKHIEWLCSNE